MSNPEFLFMWGIPDIYHARNKKNLNHVFMNKLKITITVKHLQ